MSLAHTANSIITGSSDSNVAASGSETSASKATLRDTPAKPAAMGRFASLARIAVGHRIAFQAAKKCRSTNADVAGRTVGSAMSHQSRSSPQPSSLAASKVERGIARIAAANRNTPITLNAPGSVAAA